MSSARAPCRVFPCDLCRQFLPPHFHTAAEIIAAASFWQESDLRAAAAA